MHDFRVTERFQVTARYTENFCKLSKGISYRSCLTKNYKEKLHCTLSIPNFKVFI